MASTYVLPASAMTHSHSHHHGHVHSHTQSHSHSPAGRQYSANAPIPLKHKRSNGSLHSHSQSESQFDHNHDHNRGHDHPHNHSRSSESPPSGYLPTPPYSNGLPPAPFEKYAYESSPAPSFYQPPVNAVNIYDHDHVHHGQLHTIAHVVEPRSKFTSLLLPFMLRWPLVHTIMADKDSRRIFYFMSLNFAFMMVQAFYGYLTDSLGLLSDSIHMFFDCLALAVGLFAAVASKWPPSERFPYGFGKIESLSGFGNGVFLMLISIEIMIEATERLAEGRQTKRLLELFVVSSLGLAVNLVGMACFGHHGHHHGHDHGHAGHDHRHSESSEKPHSHDEGHSDHTHSHSDDHSHISLPSSPPKAQTHVSHAHSHDNENMHGIFLHVLADTMGSAAVMVSTALIYFIGWNGWDPLASCVIAILIFMSSIPLIKSSAKKLLLTVPDDVEYNLRTTLAGVSNIRGVGSYAVPRFWMGDLEVEDAGVLGVVHVIATRGSDLDDVKERTRTFLLSHGMDVVVQVEAVGETRCWCGANSSRTPSRLS